MQSVQETASRLLAESRQDPRLRAGVYAGWVILGLVAWFVLAKLLPRGLPPGIILFGVVFGSLYAITAIGIVLIWRANRVVNFAQAELGGVAAVVAIQLVIQFRWNYFAALFIGLIGSTILGGLIYALIIRRFRNAPRLILAVATIGIAQILSGASIIVSLIFEGDPTTRTFAAPLGLSFFVSPRTFAGDDALALIAVPAVLIGLVIFMKRTRFGIAIRAAAENGDRAALMGVPILHLHVLVWALAAFLSALAAMLRVGILGFSAFTTVTGAGNALLLRTLAAAVIGKMESLPRTVAAAIGLGIFERTMAWTWSNTDVVDALLVLVILGALVLQKDFFTRVKETGISTWKAIREVRPIPAELRQLPEVRAFVWGVRGLLLAFVLTFPIWATSSQESVVALIMVYGIVAVSLLILTGWAGHISLGQFAFVGFGAASTAVLYGRHDWDFFAAMLVGIAVSALVALMIGLPALRIKGPFLAVTTLAFGVTAGSYFLEDRYFPWFIQDSITRPMLWGRIETEQDWIFYYVALAALGLALFSAWSLRHSRTGRALIAVRDNDLAAQTVSINITRLKLTAFVISGAMAGFAGAMYAISERGIFTGSFHPSVSIRLFSMVVIGGLGSLPGAVMGAVYVRTTEFFLTGGWALVSSGAGILLLLMFFPEGLGGLVYTVRDSVLRRIARRRGLVVPSLVADVRVEREEAVISHDTLLTGDEREREPATQARR